VIAQAPQCTAAEVEEAIATAAAAFPAWADTPPNRRVQVLFKMKTLLDDHLDELTKLVATENGKVFRLRGKGIDNVEGYGRGDLHVRVVVEVPAKLDGRQKKLIHELEESRIEDNYPLGRRFAQLAEAFYQRKNAMNKKDGNA
jgi:acyl-CoA reductase-like NAD-dependent aldehyde dehydrogenase